MQAIQRILDAVALPEFIPARQHFDPAHLDERGIDDRIRQQCLSTGLLTRIQPGHTVAITAGSRGIDRIRVVLRSIVRLMRERGALPHIVGCMGSHGGDADGQMAVLARMGITEEAIGAPVRTADEVELAGRAIDGRPVYANAFALAADALIVVNRVKPHTAFHAPVESGLQKMLAVGLGKQKGADACHARGFDGMYENIIDYASVIMERIPIPFGVAILENANGRVADCAVVAGERIQTEEPELLRRARGLMPRLPWDAVDVLVVSEMGKNISGSGMDTNIIGRYPLAGMCGGPEIGKIAVLDLTDASEGNAHGVGFADFISSRLFSKIVFDKTYPNCLTNKVAAPAKIPPVMPNDTYAIAAAIKTCAAPASGRVRALWIKNTHALEWLYISPALAAETPLPTSVSLCGPPSTARFDPEGFVVRDMWQGK